MERTLPHWHRAPLLNFLFYLPRPQLHVTPSFDPPLPLCCKGIYSYTVTDLVNGAETFFSGWYPISYSGNSWPFMEPEGSLSCSQQLSHYNWSWAGWVIFFPEFSPWLFIPKHTVLDPMYPISSLTAPFSVDPPHTIDNLFPRGLLSYPEDGANSFPEHRCLSAKLHGIISQKTAVYIWTSMITSYWPSKSVLIPPTHFFKIYFDTACQ
jgi:hypothetical protein